MSGTLAFAWSLSFIAEAVLMIRVWRKLRGMYNSFILYLIADITAALFLAGVVYTVPWDYASAWIALELVMVAFQLVIAIEAFRRANSLLSFAPRNLLVVLLAAAGSAVACCWLLGSPNPWPNHWLAPANALRASIEMFLGLALLFLVALPGRAPCLAKFQGRHLMILSAYLLVSSILLFAENHLYTLGSSIPGPVFMFVTLGFFSVWSMAIPRKAVPA